MISEEQMERAEREFALNAAASIAVARDAERELEHCSYHAQPYDPGKRQILLEAFQDADYMAESRSWILYLIRAARAATRP